GGIFLWRNREHALSHSLCLPVLVPTCACIFVLCDFLQSAKQGINVALDLCELRLDCLQLIGFRCWDAIRIKHNKTNTHRHKHPLHSPHTHTHTHRNPPPPPKHPHTHTHTETPCPPHTHTHTHTHTETPFHPSPT